jgi:hypothetical protein
MSKPSKVGWGLFVLGALAWLRAVNVPEEAPYLFWIGLLLLIAALFDVAYQASKRW